MAYVRRGMAYVRGRDGLCEGVRGGMTYVMGRDGLCDGVRGGMAYIVCEGEGRLM